MLSFRPKNSVQGLYFLHGIRRLLLHSTATSTDSATQSFANYLVNSLGFSDQQALKTSTKLPTKKVNAFKFSENAHSVTFFLKNHGFDDAHVRNIVSLYPKLLCAKVDKTLVPKFKLLQEAGFSGSDIVRVLVMNPFILHIDLKSCILPAIRALREITGSDFDVVSVMTKLHWKDVWYVDKNLLPNVKVLRNKGVAVEVIQKQLLWHPGTFLKKPEAFEELLSRVENRMGLSAGSSRYIYGIHLLSGVNEENMESKCRIFKSFGWTQSDVEAILVKNTCCFSLSDASIEKKLKFLMNELRFDPAYLMSHSALLTCSLEKRLMPRHKVLLILKEKRLMKKFPTFYSIICLPVSRFLEVFVLPFNEVHEVYAKLTGCDLKMLTQKRAKILS